MDTVHIHRCVWVWYMCPGVGGPASGGAPPPSLYGPCPHRHSGLLSALGLALADVVHEAQEPCALPYTPETFVQLDQRLSRLEEQCVDALRAQGFPRWGSGGRPGRRGACSSLATSFCA